MNLKKILVLLISIFSSFLVTSITVDGKLDESEWQKAKLINNFVTVYFNERQKTTDREIKYISYHKQRDMP